MANVLFLVFFAFTYIHRSCIYYFTSLCVNDLTYKLSLLVYKRIMYAYVSIFLCACLNYLAIFLHLIPYRRVWPFYSKRLVVVMRKEENLFCDPWAFQKLFVFVFHLVDIFFSVFAYLLLCIEWWGEVIDRIFLNRDQCNGTRSYQ